MGNTLITPARKHSNTNFVIKDFTVHNVTLLGELRILYPIKLQWYKF